MNRRRIVSLIGILLATLVMSACSTTTALVTHEKGTVTLPRGEMAILNESVGNYDRAWAVTFDGTRINFEQDALFFPGHFSVTLEEGFETSIAINDEWPLIVTTDGESAKIVLPRGYGTPWSFSPYDG